MIAGLAPAVLAVILVASLAGAGSSEVSIQDGAFSPEILTVTLDAQGKAVVVWTNQGRKAHDVVAMDGTWRSGVLRPGDSFTHTFASAGVFSYRSTQKNDSQAVAGICASGMCGSVHVLPGGSTPAPQPTSASTSPRRTPKPTSASLPASAGTATPSLNPTATGTDSPGPVGADSAGGSGEGAGVSSVKIVAVLALGSLAILAGAGGIYLIRRSS
ncbi:MAG: hypothetical protein WDA71_05165 [Actinomycetota bacterium]